MPLYNTATTAAALGVSPKWLDNLLSHNDIQGVATESQGVARRLPLSVVTALALAMDLIDDLAIPAPAALRLASRILSTNGGQLVVPSGLRLSIDLESLHSRVLEQLARAVETAPTPRRGRPPKR